MLRPPKGVDILQAFVIELPNRKGRPLHCVERMITGQYIKYNSNAGFVETESPLATTGSVSLTSQPARVGMRQTPQAFSAFTFWASECKAIIVDIQGVDDVYTDPQVASFFLYYLLKYFLVLVVSSGRLCL